MRHTFTSILTIVIFQLLPVSAHAYRWGRTDASVAEPGAYALAFLLVPLFIAVLVWGLSTATLCQSDMLRGVVAAFRAVLGLFQYWAFCAGSWVPPVMRPSFILRGIADREITGGGN